MAARWTVDGDVLLIADGSGGRYIPSADEVFGQVFRSKTPAAYPEINHPSESVSEFSRFPLELYVCLDREPVSPSGVALRFRARAKGVDFDISDLMTRSANHFVHDGVWYPFVHGQMETVREKLHEVGIEGPGNISLRDYLGLRKIKDLIVQDSTEASLAAENLAETVSRIEPDRIFTGTLYGYQKKGSAWLSFMADQNMGCILADEMGLGKTIQVIALMAHRLSVIPGRKTLVVCPATLLENWRREIGKFATGLQTIIHRGSDRTGLPSELKENDVILTSYETAIRDQYLLNMLNWDLVVLDEAQAIKNPDAQRTIAIKSLPKNIVIAVTGTPVQNNLIDMWSLIDAVLPGYLGNQEAFRNEYPPDSVDAARELENIASPIILRRKVADVASDLPERIDIPQYLALDLDSVSRYEEIRKSILARGPGASLAALTILRMFCTHPFLVDPSNNDPQKFSNKYCRLVEILEEIVENREKALIFTSFTNMADILVSDLHVRFGILVELIDGRVAVEKRQPIIDRFNSYPRPAVLVLNPKAAGTGLNITGANHVIHYNPEWNPAIEDQSTARAYRRGQKLPVTVHRFIYADTVEEVMDNILERKRGLAEQAVVGVDGSQVDHDDLLRALRISPSQEGKNV